MFQKFYSAMLVIFSSPTNSYSIFLPLFLEVEQLLLKLHPAVLLLVFFFNGLHYSSQFLAPLQRVDPTSSIKF